MRIHPARGLLLIALLAAPAVRGGEDPFGRAPALVSILRVARIRATNRRMERFLRQIHPHSTLRDPIETWIAGYLRNPGLQELDDDSFLEVLFFDPRSTRGSPVAVAFPVEDGDDYRAVLTGQAAIREERTLDEITAFREETHDGSRVYYLAIGPNRTALFGPGREAVRRARDLYLHYAPGGLMKDVPAAVSVRFHLRRYLSITDESLRTGMRQLREDLVRDLSGDAGNEEAGMDRAMQHIFDGLRGILDQVPLVEAGLRFEENALEARLRIRTARGTLLRHILANVPRRPCSLESRLPSDAVLLYGSCLWPELWTPLLEEAGAVLATGFGGVIGPEVRDTLGGLLKTLTDADPLEYASALLPPPEGEPEIGYFSVKLVRWRRPRALETLIGRFSEMLTPGPVTELLDRNGVKFEFSRRRGIARLAETPVDHLRLELRVTGDRKLETLLPGFGKPRDYLMARRDDVVVLLTSPSRGSPGDEEAETAAQARRNAMERVLLLLGEEAADEPGTGDRGAAPARLRLAPLGFVQLAMNNAADWRHLSGLRAAPATSAKHARAFASFPRRGEPLGMVLQADAEDGIVRIRAPLTSIRALARACLDIASREHADK